VGLSAQAITAALSAEGVEVGDGSL